MSEPAQPSVARVQLATMQPFAAEALLGFLGARAVDGVESVRDDTYARTLRLEHGPGVVALTIGPEGAGLEVEAGDPRDVPDAVERCRRLLDLDTDPAAVARRLSADPALEPLVRAAPGLRLPGHVDGFEVAVRAVLGQQVSVAGARTTAGRLVERFGEPLAGTAGSLAARRGLHALFPTAERLAGADPNDLGVPRQRGRALVALASAVASSAVELGPTTDPESLHEALVALPGIGPWTASYIVMRALSHPDTLLPGDLVIRKAMSALGTSSTELWRPWRSYAVIHLWRYASAHRL